MKLSKLQIKKFSNSIGEIEKQNTNIMDIMTCDDLLQRLSNIIDKFKMNKKSLRN